MIRCGLYTARDEMEKKAIDTYIVGSDLSCDVARHVHIFVNI